MGRETHRKQKGGTLSLRSFGVEMVGGKIFSGMIAEKETQLGACSAFLS